MKTADSGCDALLDAFVYEADGRIFWRVNRGPARAGHEAGSVHSKGYRHVYLNGKHYLTHRIVWALHHGSWPVSDIDHINGIKDDNRIENLRDVSKSVNLQNQKRARRDNFSGSSIPGVCWHKLTQKFQAYSMLNGKQIHLGLFSNREEAVAVVLEYRRANYAGNTL